MIVLMAKLEKDAKDLLKIGGGRGGETLHLNHTAALRLIVVLIPLPHSDSFPDSDLESDLSSYESSPSSDGRHQKRKRSSRSEKIQHTQKRRDRHRVRRGQNNVKSRRKSKWSSSKSGSESETSSSSRSSSGDDRSEETDSAHKTKKPSDAGKKSLAHLGKKMLKCPQKMAGTSCHEVGEFSLGTDGNLSNGQNADIKSEKIVDPLPPVPSKSRSLTLSPEQTKRVSPKKVSPESSAGAQHCNRSPVQDAAAPPISNNGEDVGRSPQNGVHKRIRKGRGFNECYSFACRYRTPSPERSPHQQYSYDGRAFYDRNDDRYDGWRRESRSISPSPSDDCGHGRGNRSPTHSPSPQERSSIGPQADDRHPSARYGSKTRSLSLPHTKSPNAVLQRPQERSPDTTSSSPPGQKALVSYGDASPDTGSS